MNLPNKLTVIRMIATPIFMFTMVAKFEGHFFSALIVFALASFTDMLECIPSKTLRTHFEYEYERRGFSPSPEEMMCIAFNSACYL